MGLLDARSGSPERGKHQSVSVPRKAYGLAAPYSESLTTPESVYVAVSSTRVKMQEEREKTKQNKTEHQDRVKLKKEQKGSLSGAKRISEIVVRGFPKGGGSSVPQCKEIDFPFGGACSSQERWLLCSPGVSWPQRFHSHSPKTLPYASHSTLLM